MRCGCGYLHANIPHKCNAKPSKERHLSRDGTRCSDCTCAHVPCRTCWTNAGYLAHKFDKVFAAALANRECPECHMPLSMQSR